MAELWQSYDSAATAHDRLAVPAFFTRPAQDLIERIDLPDSGTILDVGTGTGIVARLIVEIKRPGLLVTGLDPSVEMLRIARSHGVLAVAGVAPGLPFRDESMDRILSNFALSHLSSYQAGLLDMLRVLRPGGRLGATAWGSFQCEPRQCWQTIADSFASKERMEAAVQQGLPWDEWFGDAGHLRAAFEDAGLSGVELHHAHYPTRMTIAEFLATREASLQGRFLRQSLGPQRWKEFTHTVSADFHRIFNDPLEYDRDAHIAIGRRP